jgi:hypothetical protein
MRWPRLTRAVEPLKNTEFGEVNFRKVNREQKE